MRKNLYILLLVVALTGLISCTQSPVGTVADNSKQSAVVTKEYHHNGNSYFVKMQKNEDGTWSLLPGPDNDIIQSICEEPESGLIYDQNNPDVAWLAKNHVEYDSLVNMLQKQKKLAKKATVIIPPKFKIPPARGAHLYKDRDFSGNHLLVTSNIYNLADYDYNDMLSSVLAYRCGGITIYEHSNFGGHALGILPDGYSGTAWISNLKDYKMSGALLWKKTWNDKASSIRWYWW